jgi:NADH dehydrogenase
MKIAITGGTGFVGGHFARYLIGQGHDVVLIARGLDKRDKSIRELQRASIAMIGTNNEQELAKAFKGCDAVAHCAGINREIGEQTYQRVHIEGTQHVVNAARTAGVKRMALLSFLRARPNCGSPYHESKWAAEEIIRKSGLDYTVLKAGVIYGQGDYMLDHLSHAFNTFPFFALVGMKAKPIRPTAVEDITHILSAALIDGRLARQTVAVIGPDEMSLTEAVTRVAKAIGKVPPMVRLPIFLHRIFAFVFELTMKTPLLSSAQLRILSEGIVEAVPFADPLPDDLKPKTPFSEQQIKKGLPPPKAFGLKDLKWF